MPLQRLATGPIRDDATSGVSTATAGSDQRSFAVQKTTSKSTVEKPLLPGTPEHAEKQTVYSRATKTELTDKRSSRRASSYHGRSETGSQDSPTESQRMRRKTASLRIWTTNSIMSTEQEQRKSERVTVVGNIQRQTSKNVRFDVPKTSSYYASSPGSSETDVSNGDVGTASSRFSIVSACSWASAYSVTKEGGSSTRSARSPNTESDAQDALLSVEGIPLEEHEKCTRNVPFRFYNMPRLFSLPPTDEKAARRSAAALAVQHRLTLALNEESIADQRVTRTLLLLLAEPTGYSSTCNKTSFLEFLMDPSSTPFPSFIDAWIFMGGGVFKPHLTLLDFVTALLALKRCDLLHAWDSLGRGNSLHLTHVMPQGLHVVRSMARFVRSIFHRGRAPVRLPVPNQSTLGGGDMPGADDPSNRGAAQRAYSFTRCWTRRFRGPIVTRAQWTNVWAKDPALGDLVWQLFGDREGIHMHDAEPFFTVCDQVAAHATGHEEDAITVREDPAELYSRVMDRDWCYPIPRGGAKEGRIAFTRDNEAQTELEGICTGEQADKEFVRREAWAVEGPFVFPKQGGKTTTAHRMMMRRFVRLQNVAAKLLQKHAHPSITNLKLREVLLEELRTFIGEPLLAQLETEIQALHARIANQVAAHRAYIETQKTYEEEIATMLAEDAPPDRSPLPIRAILSSSSPTSSMIGVGKNEDESYVAALRRDLGEFALEYGTDSQLPGEGSRWSGATAFTAPAFHIDKGTDFQNIRGMSLLSSLSVPSFSPRAGGRDFELDLRILTAQHERKVDAFTRIHAVCSCLENYSGEHILYVYDMVKSTLPLLGSTTPTIDAFVKRAEEELDGFKGKAHFMKIIKSMDEASPGELVHAQLTFATAARTAKNEGAAWFDECMHDAMKANFRAQVKLSLKDSVKQLNTSLALNVKPLFRAKMNLQKLCTHFDEAAQVMACPKWAYMREDATKALQKMEAAVGERSGGLRYAALVQHTAVDEHDSMSGLSPTVQNRGSRATDQSEDVVAARPGVAANDPEMAFKIRSHSLAPLEHERDGGNAHFVFDAVFKDVAALIREECVPLVHAAAKGDVALLMWLGLPKRPSDIFGNEGIVKHLRQDIFKLAQTKVVEVRFIGMQGRNLRCWEAGDIEYADDGTVTELKEHEFVAWHRKAFESFKSEHERMALCAIIDFNKGKLILCELSCGFQKNTRDKADLLQLTKLFPSQGLEIAYEPFVANVSKKLTMVLAAYFPQATTKRFIVSLDQDVGKLKESIEMLRFIETLTSRTSPHLSSVQEKHRTANAHKRASVHKNKTRAASKVGEHTGF